MSEYANYDDYNDPDEEYGYDAENDKKLTVGKVLRKTFIYTLRLLAFAVIAVLLWRVFSGDAPKTMQNLLWTESSIQKYYSSPKEYEVYHYKHKDNMTRDGKFSASHVYFSPSADQIQITLRYNNSTIDKLIAEYSLEKLPEGEPFVFVLSDNNGNTYTDYQFISDTKNMYNYRRLVFDGVDINFLLVGNPPAGASEEEVEQNKKEKAEKQLTLKIYYREDVLLSEPYGSLSVFDYSYYHEPIDVKKYVKNDLIPHNGLTVRPDYSVKEEPEETEDN